MTGDRPSFCLFLGSSFELFSNSSYFRTSVFAHITTQVRNRVVQELHHILRVVYKRPWILLAVLIVECGSEQARSPDGPASGCS